MPYTQYHTNYKLLRVLLRPWFKWILGINIKVEGREYIPPKGAAILICNHRSEQDAALISLIVGRYVSWIYADYLRKNIFSKWLFSKTGMIPANTEGKLSSGTIHQIHDVLENDELLGIFPEGHEYLFNNDFQGLEFANFRPGFAVIAKRKQVPIIPMVLKPIEEKLTKIHIPKPMRPDLERVTDLAHLKHTLVYKKVRLIIGEPIPHDFFEGKTVAEVMYYCKSVMANMLQK